MDALVTMSAPPAALSAHQAPLQQPAAASATISVRSPTSAGSGGGCSSGSTAAATGAAWAASPHKETATGATVFVASVTDVAGSRARIPEVQPASGRDSRQPAHVVKIQINPSCDSSRLISTVRLNLEEPLGSSSGCSFPVVSNGNGSAGVVVLGSEGQDKSVTCIRVKSCEYAGSESSSSEELQSHSSEEVGIGSKNDMVQQRCVPESRAASSCFYYSSPLSTMLMSSGQCSPSETLDSGTCSDLDGTPPPLPKKKGSSTVVLGAGSAPSHQRHDRTGSLTSSGAELDSDDNESSISCDSLNSGELPSLNQAAAAASFRVSRSLELRSGGGKQESLSPPASGTSTLSKASSTTPRIRSPDTGRSSACSSPIVSECTYEERRREEFTAPDPEAASTMTKVYAYEDDRFYKFHVNERDEMAKSENSAEDKGRSAENDDECFAGYKILEREAIRSAKGTVRGVKNRVRAGIATFLQKPSSKNYKAKDAGKVVVYTTTMGIVRETYYRCVLVKQILRTHMVKYEERDMYMSTESQTELRDRIGCAAIEVPQLFIDGQYIGDAHTVERLNESGELRQMLKPYKSLDACSTCQMCGGYRLLPCPVCNGSKKSEHRNEFTAEFIALKCMNCDEVGLVRCPNC
ncbi:glutaredoxin domain-containing cysteine-rich protein CG12206-like [Nasonia vitripennis]|uniref:Glutaredoxin domain-containing protein n=1 Tax=Nasonia vitripennis TaxID=7425 RepID=A0A7M7LJ65_NASVI|nr:glutaredoxin domain-containing cysteine-rich protein CG12206-like [Nasonia vitripennis]XP_032457613.1 glutaredoxin domain-containing cysteine-rich protein CG12206-like [Nasonia vitripennis]